MTTSNKRQKEASEMARSDNINDWGLLLLQLVDNELQAEPLIINTFHVIAAQMPQLKLMHQTSNCNLTVHTLIAYSRVSCMLLLDN